MTGRLHQSLARNLLLVAVSSNLLGMPGAIAQDVPSPEEGIPQPELPATTGTEEAIPVEIKLEEPAPGAADSLPADGNAPQPTLPAPKEIPIGVTLEEPVPGVEPNGVASEDIAVEDPPAGILQDKVSPAAGTDEIPAEVTGEEVLPSGALIGSNSFCPEGTEPVPLAVVGAGSTEVSKEISGPSIPFGVATIRNNWDSYWAIPGGIYFEEFVIAFIPETTATFKLEANLKYGNNTENQIYAPIKQDFVQGEPIYIRGRPRLALQPYQVNLKVGGLKSGGYFYRAVAVGCQPKTIPVAVESTSQTCLALPVVGGEAGQTTVKKKVNQPTIPFLFGAKIARNNWNTDWLVPSPDRFERFIATVEPGAIAESGPVNVRLFLKYSDGTADEIFKAEDYDLSKGEPLEIAALPRPGRQPYQVNLFVGGLGHLGNQYSATIHGCY